MIDVNAVNPTPPTPDDITQKEMYASAGAATQMSPALAYPYHHYDHAAEKKLQIFHTILQQRHDLTPEGAADAAEKVFQKLCIAQAPQ